MGSCRRRGPAPHKACSPRRWLCTRCRARLRFPLPRLTPLPPQAPTDLRWLQRLRQGNHRLPHRPASLPNRLCHRLSHHGPLCHPWNRQHCHLRRANHQKNHRPNHQLQCDQRSQNLPPSSPPLRSSLKLLPLCRLRPRPRRRPPSHHVDYRSCRSSRRAPGEGRKTARGVGRSVPSDSLLRLPCLLCTGRAGAAAGPLGRDWLAAAQRRPVAVPLVRNGDGGQPLCPSAALRVAPRPKDP